MEGKLDKVTDNSFISTDDESEGSDTYSSVELTASALRDIDAILLKRFSNDKHYQDINTKICFSNYVKRLTHYSQAEESLAVGALVFLDRYLKAFGLESLKNYSLQILYGACYCLAMKVNEETGVWRAQDLSTLTGVPLQTLCKLEAEMVLNLQLFVSEEAFENQLLKLTNKYSSSCRILSNAGSSEKERS